MRKLFFLIFALTLLFPSISFATKPDLVFHGITSLTGSPNVSTSTTPKAVTITGISGGLKLGDIIVATTITNANATTAAPTSDSSGGAISSFTQQVSLGAATYGRVYIGTATVISATSSAFDITFTRNATSGPWGGEIYIFRNSGGIGTSGSNHNNTALPTVSMTTSANSAIVIVNGDNAAFDVTNVTWLTYNGDSFIPEINVKNSANYTYYGGYYDDTGSAGTFTAGQSSNPQGQEVWTIGALEILGTVVIPSTNVTGFGGGDELD